MATETDIHWKPIYKTLDLQYLLSVFFEEREETRIAAVCGFSNHSMVDFFGKLSIPLSAMRCGTNLFCLLGLSILSWKSALTFFLSDAQERQESLE